jgi:acetyltransferase-like isoleucine patch superfamily enzyme
MKNIIGKIKEYNTAGCNPIVFVKYLYYYLFFGKKIIAHQRAIIKGVRRIEASKGSVLYVGVRYRGFLTRHDRTLVRIRGTLKIDGKVYLDRGVRIDITPTGTMEMANNSSVNSFTTIICENKISFGENSGISWGGQMLNTDFHDIKHPGRKEKDPSIVIGKNVMIGCRTSVYKGVHIPDGCVVASDSVIKKDVTSPNTLVATDSTLREIPGVEWKY